MKLFNLIFIFFILLTCNYGWAQRCLPASVQTLQSGIFELKLSNVWIKVEVYNNIAKMKLVGEVNQDWTSVTTENGPAMISGFLGNGDSSKLLSESVILVKNDNFWFAVAKKDKLDDSMATIYFASKKGVKCTINTWDRWQETKNKFFPRIHSYSAVNLEPDGIL